MIAAAGVALLATSATAPDASVEVPENPRQPLPPAESSPRAWAAEVDPPAAPQPAAVAVADDAGATIPATFTGEIPAKVIDAYRRARDAVNRAQPGCHLPMELLAAIGKVETGHARGGLVDSQGTTVGPILGPVLDGNGFAAVPDTDGGLLDGDPTWDRAVGPMQFVPGTWRRWQSDGNGDHRADPNNVYDASLAAARYLCADNRDLATPQGLDEAILSYDHSASYRNLVLSWMATYTSGTTVVPDAASGPVQAILLPPTKSIPPASSATAPPASATAPVTPAPTVSPASSPAGTPAPVTEPAAPSPVPVAALPQPLPQPPAQPPGPIAPVVCGVGGLVGGLLGPILGTPVLPPCPNVDQSGQ